MKRFYLSIIALVAAVMPSMAQTELWNNADQSIQSTYLAPGWNADANSTATYDPETGVVNIHIDKGLSAQWQGQVKMTTTGISYDPAKYYVFSCTFNTNNAVKNVTVKLDDVAGVLYDNKIALAVGDNEYVGKASKGATGGNNILVFDFGYAPAQTDIVISNISIKEYTTNPDDDKPVVVVDPLDYNDPNNLWKKVDSGEAFVSVTPWFANNSWAQIADPAWTHEGSKWNLTLPEGMGANQWQGQFPINTSLTANVGEECDFCCIIESTNDLSDVTIKLVQTNESETVKHDGNFFFEGRHDVKAGQKYVYVEKGVTLGQNDAHALSLFFDFGGCPVGSQVTISDVVFINHSAAPAALKGDANNDGGVTMADANLVVNAYTTGNTDAIASVDNADVTGEGEITMADANGIVNIYVGE